MGTGAEHICEYNIEAVKNGFRNCFSSERHEMLPMVPRAACPLRMDPLHQQRTSGMRY